MKFDAIIFDMDGLLVDSEIVWYKAEDELITDRGFVYSEEVRDSIVGMRIDQFLAKLKEIYNLPETVEQLIVELEGRMLTLIPQLVKPNAGAQAIIDFVIKNNIPHAIASNSSINIINVTLQSQGWGDIFDVRCTGDDEVSGKPDPYVYLRAAEKLGVDPKRCLALEDSPNGSKAAVAAGMTCYAVPDLSHSTPESFKHITPHVFKNLNDVLADLLAE
ncbi:MAG TPA: HAD family phosphatase [Aggregatilineales bacterium]|nr:HAD family phosphatase [Aggregatilineales bacterium]